MFTEKTKAAQPEFWIATDQVVTTAQSGFYAKLEDTLESFGFSVKVRALCQPAYDKSGVGRPGIDPVVYLKMIMVGFFEDLPSERAIAARCADSMSIRSFLKYDLHEKTPEHSSFTVIRQRLGLEVYQQIFTLTLQALREHGLLRGKNLGIDSSVIEANASLRALVHRNTEEQYWDYVKRLAAEQGIDPQDTTAVRRFDRHRPGKGSNQEWQNRTIRRQIGNQGRCHRHDLQTRSGGGLGHWRDRAGRCAAGRSGRPQGNGRAGFGSAANDQSSMRARAGHADGDERYLG